MFRQRCSKPRVSVRAHEQRQSSCIRTFDAVRKKVLFFPPHTQSNSEAGAPDDAHFAVLAIRARLGKGGSTQQASGTALPIRMLTESAKLRMSRLPRFSRFRTGLVRSLPLKRTGPREDLHQGAEERSSPQRSARWVLKHRHPPS
jgi:hypothetical protein